MEISEFSTQGADTRAVRLCVIVCGLHHSGTSAVTRVVNLLGADIAHDLLPADPGNSRGYWESYAVLAIHDHLLQTLLQTVTASPDHAFDPTPLPAGWQATEAAREAARQLTSVVQGDFGDSCFFVVKDNRIWRLLPLWVGLLQDLGIAPLVVIPFRNPLEAAASLAQRGHIPLPKALFLYFCTYLETELSSRALPRLFVRYDSLLQDWQPLARNLHRISAGKASPPSGSVAAAIDRFLTTDLYHHRFGREHMLRRPDFPAAIVEMFDAMDDAAESGDEGRLRSSFDRLRADGDATARLYNGFLVCELQSLRDRLMREIVVREAFETSTSWRVTAPLRWLKLQAMSRLASARRGTPPAAVPGFSVATVALPWPQEPAPVAGAGPDSATGQLAP